MKKGKIKILKARNKEYYWAVFAKNGKELIRSSETNKQKRTVLSAIKNIKAIMADPEVKVIDETLTPTKK